MKNRRRASARGVVCALRWILVLLVASAAGAAGALPVTFDYGRADNQTVSSHTTCGGRVVTARSNGLPANIRLQTNSGVGTGATAELDDGEVLVVDFPAPVQGVTYGVPSIVDVDNDGMAGETLLVAFDAGGAMIGSKLIFGPGPIDVNTELGVFQLARLEIAPQGDRITVRRITHEPNDGDSVGLSFTTLGAVSGTSYAQCGFTMTPSAPDILLTSTANGLAVSGFPNQLSIDFGEYVDIAFAIEPLDYDVKIRTGQFSSRVDVTYFDDNDTVRGTSSIVISPGSNDWEDVSALYTGNKKIAKVRMEVGVGNIGITGVRAVPEPRALAAGAVALAALGLVRRRRNASP